MEYLIGYIAFVFCFFLAGTLILFAIEKLLVVTFEALKDMSFTIEGLSHAIRHSERMCMSNYDIYETDIQETNYI